MTTKPDSKLGAMTTPDILSAIEAAQAIQKRNPPTSADWQDASTVLHVLFAEMARRESR